MTTARQHLKWLWKNHCVTGEEHWQPGNRLNFHLPLRKKRRNTKVTKHGLISIFSVPIKIKISFFWEYIHRHMRNHWGTGNDHYTSREGNSNSRLTKMMSSVGFLHFFSVTDFKELQKVGCGEKLEVKVTVVQLQSSLPNSRNPHCGNSSADVPIQTQCSLCPRAWGLMWLFQTGILWR